jgi:protein involved in polysaccharide export with SLBB domain
MIQDAGRPRRPTAPIAATLVAAFAFALALAACSSTPLQPPNTPTAAAQVLPVAAAAAPPAYQFAIGDDFDLRVPDAPQFDQSLKVRPDGKVSLPLIGTLYVMGRTPEDVESELRERLRTLGGAPGTREYLLQPNDEIEVKFPYTPQFNEVQKLRPDGKIALQLVGTIDAQGRSPEELQAELRSRYARVLRSSELTVIVRSVTTQNIRIATASGAVAGRAGLAALQPTIIVRSTQLPQVFVSGEVAKPGVLGWRTGLTLLQALAEAGGTLPTGDGAHIVVLRRVAATAGRPEGMQVMRLDLPQDFARQPDRDVALQPSDIVLLPKSDIAVLGDKLNQYLFNIIPPLKNSSFSYAIQRGSSNTSYVSF